MLPIDHIQITVKDMGVAEPFYDQLMPILGFDLNNKVSAEINEHDLYVVEYLHPAFDFGICSPRVFPEHGENYYACFFKDLEGIKYEIVYNGA